MSNWEIQKMKINLPIPINKFAFSVGVDPGTANMGIAVIEGKLDNPYAIIFQVKIERSYDPIERIRATQEIMSQCVFWYQMPMVATVEGSAFSSRYRQTELAEVRTSAALWCIQKGFATEIINPLTIRKEVFGDSKLKPHEVWVELKKMPDAAQALACAYYPLI